MVERLKQLLLRINREVDALPNPGIRTIGQHLLLAEKELARDLARWLATHPDGDMRFTPQSYRAAMFQIRAALDRIKKVNPTIYSELVKARDLSYRLGIDHLSKILEHFDTNPIPLGAFVTMTKKDLLITRFEKAVSKYGNDVLLHLQRQLAVGLVRGETIYQMTNRLVRLSGPARPTRGLPTGDAIAQGLMTMPRYAAERLVRTEVIHAYNVQSLDTLKEVSKDDPEMKVQWNAALDSRVCPICAALDGEVVSPGEAFSNGLTEPPDHPNCRCAVVAWKTGWE